MTTDSSHPTHASVPSPGPLAGVRILEIAGIGPVPHAAMLLADMGADVVQIGRPGSTAELNDGYKKHVARGRTTIEADLKDSADVANVLTLVERSDVLIEGFRPGVTERLGLGPRGVRSPKPTPDLRTHDRMGAVRPRRDACRTRHQLSCNDWSFARDGPQRRAATRTPQLGRRLRWRFHVPCCRNS